MPETTLPELVARFQNLNPTSCETSEIIELQHRMGTVRIEDQDMRQTIQEFLVLDAEAASDEDISYLQARMGREMERLDNNPANQTPPGNSTSGDSMMGQSALKWISETAKSMGVADEDDGLFFQTRALTGWIEDQLAHNTTMEKVLKILRDTLKNRGFLTDGDPVTVAERLKLMALEDKELFSMKEGNNNILKERLAEALERLKKLQQNLTVNEAKGGLDDPMPPLNRQTLETTLEQIRQHIELKKDREVGIPTLGDLRGWEAAIQEALEPNSPLLADGVRENRITRHPGFLGGHGTGQ